MRPLLFAVDTAPPPVSAAVDVVGVERAVLAQQAGRALESGRRRIGVAGSDADAAVVAGEAYRLGAPIELAIDVRGDLARMFGLGESVEARLAAGTPYPIDIGLVEGSWGATAFLNDIGFGAAGVAPGVLRWVAAPRAEVAVTGRRRVGAKASGVLVGNGQFWHGLAVSPRASLMDGRLEYQVIAVPRWRTARTLRAMRFGLHASTPGLLGGRGGSLTVDTPARWGVVADRRHIGRGSATVTAIPGVVSLLI